MAKISVANLYKTCSLVMVVNADGHQITVICNQVASTAVQTSAGLSWRCGAHRGIINAVFGEVVTTVEDDRPIPGARTL
jgi:hypothetical protein